MRRKIFAFLVLATFLPALAVAQEGDPYYDDDYWGDWLWEAEGLVVMEERPPRRLQEGSVAVEVISAEEIQNSTAVTLADVLADHGMLMGEYRTGASDHQGGRVVMQGVDGGNVTFLINGRRVAGRQNENIIEATLPLSNVERIEIIRGPQSVRHGSAVGGVINIITREPEEDRLTLSASFTNRFLIPQNDTDSYSQAGFDPAREQNLTAAVGFPIGRSRNSIDVEASRGSFHFDETGITSILPQFTRGRVGFESALPLTDDIDLSYGISGMMLRTEHQTMVAATAANRPGEHNQVNRRDYVRFDAHVGVDWFVSDEIELNFGLSNSYYHREVDIFLYSTNQWRAAGPVRGFQNIADFNVTGSWLFRPGLLFTGGVEAGVQVVEGERFPDQTIVWQNYELFLEAEHFVENRYSVALGVRGMVNPRFGPMAIPRASGSLHLGNGFRLLAGGGMGYRVPSFNSLYSQLMEGIIGIGYGGQAQGNPDLIPETSVGANLGLEWTGRRAFFHANFFHTELWNQIGAPTTLNPAPGEPGHMPGLTPVGPPAGSPPGTPDQAPHGRFRSWLNLDRTLRTGVDAEARLNLPMYMFVTAGYSWVFGWDRTAGNEIVLSPPHTVRGRIGVNIPSPNISAHVNFRWAAGFTTIGAGPPFQERYDADGNIERVPTATSSFESVFNMGLFAAYRINENWRVNFGIDNLLGATNENAQRTGQTFSLGVTFTH